MGWERRGVGLYYYQSRREGTRIVKEYVGRGLLAELIAQADAALRNDERATGQAISAEQERIGRAEAESEALHTAAEAALCRSLTAAGFHRHHRGEWRKRRKPNDEGPTEAGHGERRAR